ncbi:disease resistance protein At4g27190-like [Syzygium oleosum]|uniref:disease resistance protein At4g27190-like n=1 Tax=Syzygium oleosum TaxID=219896 RepID=UPI0024B95650|nr:disease resistance protein At4g27190-like [Syzygium oleosum]
MDSMLDDGPVNSSADPGRNISFRYRQSRRAVKRLKRVKELISSCNFQVMLANRKSPSKVVQRMAAESLAGQEAALETLKRLMEFINDDHVNRIAVWGMGGVGKTTLLANLNNIYECSLTESFDIVIWVTVSKDSDLVTIQSLIAERLNLEFEPGESMQRRANRIYQRLMLQRTSLLILDDVWEKIDLKDVGVPHGDDQAKCKIVLTTRSFDVCRDMMTDEAIKVEVLREEAAWDLFMQSAGDAAKVSDIEPIAQEICKRCCGLPLAIKTVGKSMRSKRMIELWKDTLRRLKLAVPSGGSSIEKEVYWSMKLSYDFLPSKIHQSCFLFCSLYPGNFSIKESELIQCWIADGLIDKHQTIEESFNNGIAMIENLKDSCMLEQGDGIGTVKMHNVWRDIAVYISSVEKESGFFPQSRMSIYELPEKLQHARRRISQMNSNIHELPPRVLGCSKLTVLFLQGNPLKKIPYGFIHKMRALRYLNLSCTLICSLPLSLFQLSELHTLILRDCRYLENLPPLGALCKLEVLDLSGTLLRQLPMEMDRLDCLRVLHLAGTRHLEYIKARTFSVLSNLEELDMSFSAYTWDMEQNLGGERATLDELVLLENLSNLQIRLDTVQCLVPCRNWLGRLKRFRIWISPRICESSYCPIQQDEKRAILRGVDLMVLERGLEVLLDNVSALDLIKCGGISELTETVSKMSLRGLQNLKSLSITGCSWIKVILSGEKIQHNVLPNLENLTLSRLEKLVKIVDGMIPKGCLDKLKTIEVVDCPKLKKLISYAFLRRLRNLNKIKIEDCERMKSVILGKLSGGELPKLRVLEMRDLKSLRMISPGMSDWPSLERIEVSNCPKLDRLPFAFQNGFSIREIRGDLEWWNNIKWPSDDIKISLQERFQVFIATPSTRGYREVKRISLP